MEDFKINVLAPRGGGVNFFNLLLKMSYNIPKMLSSVFQNPSIKILDSKLTLLIILTLIAARGGVKILNVILGMS